MSSTEQGTRTQAQRSALSDSRLVDAAIQLIVERGPEKATLRALGEAAGYSRGLVTYQFGSKTGLFKAVIKSVSERFLAQMTDAVGDLTGADAIAAIAGSVVRFARKSPADIRAMRILFYQATQPGSELVDIVNRVHAEQRRQLAQWVTEGQQAGTVSPLVDPQSFAVRFVACFEGIMFFWMIDAQQVDWDRVSNDLFGQYRAELLNVSPK